MKVINGFDYLAGSNVTRTSDEWRRILADTLKAGGQRRVENGETFIHAKGGLITHEVYANVQATQVQP